MEKWYAAQPEEAHGWWVVSRDPEGYDCIDASGDGGFNEPEARLIAAAPDLLAAAKLARAQLIAAGLDGHGSGLDAAIAKAEGEP